MAPGAMSAVSERCASDLMLRKSSPVRSAGRALAPVRFDPARMRFEQIGDGHRQAAQIAAERRIGERGCQIGAVEHRARHLGADENGAVQIRAGQIAGREIGVLEIGAGQFRLAQIGARQPAIAHDGVAEIRLHRHHARHLRAFEIGGVEKRGRKFRRSHVVLQHAQLAETILLRDRAFAQIGFVEIGADQIGAAQRRAAQVRAPQAGAFEIGAPEIRAEETGRFEARARKIRLFEDGAGEVRIGQIAPGEVEARKVAKRENRARAAHPPGIEHFMPRCGSGSLLLGQFGKADALRRRHQIASTAKIAQKGPQIFWWVGANA